MNKAAEQWVGIINGELVCHTGIIQFPMRKGWKRVHRLVVLPDYQGIGVGTKFINFVCKTYVDSGWMVNLTTTTPALVHSLRRSEDWVLVRYGRVKNTLRKNFEKYYSKKESKGIGSSDNRITYSFNYKLK
mgnify:CR=1 FL=1